VVRPCVGHSTSRDYLDDKAATSSGEEDLDCA
jgi:hypothetical protein